MDHQQLFDDRVELGPDDDIAKTTLAVPVAAGVCLFTTSEDKPILLLYGAGLRAVVRHRLTEPDSREKSRRTPVRPLTRRLWLRRTYSRFETELAYFHIARAVYPDRYRQFFKRLDAWFVSLEREEDYPFFQNTRQVHRQSGLYWGPLAEKSSAQRFIEVLENVFGLCRHPRVLSDAPHATACPYAQMGQCPSVCDGTISRQEYLKILDQAVDFLNTDVKTSVSAFQQKMEQFAAEKEYERAQQVKTRLDEVRKLLAPAFRWVSAIDRFWVLAFQTGPPTKLAGERAAQASITPFLIGPGWISQIEPFSLEQADQACRSLLDHFHLQTMQAEAGAEFVGQGELLSWAARYLYRPGRDKGLYLRPDEISDAAELAAQVTRHFGAKTKESR